MQKTIIMCVFVLSMMLSSISRGAVYAWEGTVDTDMANLNNWNPNPGTTATLQNGEMLITAQVNAPVASANFGVGPSGTGYMLIRNGGNVTWDGRYNTIGNTNGNGTVILNPNGEGETATLSVTYNGPDSCRFVIGNSTNAVGLLEQRVDSTFVWGNSQHTLYMGYGSPSASATWLMKGGSATGVNLVMGYSGSTALFDYIGETGTVDMSGSLTGASTATFDFDLSGSGHTIFTVAGDVDLSSTTLNIDGTPDSGSVFNLFNVGGTLSTSGIILNLGEGWSVSYTGGDGNDVFATYIPEPATMVLLSIGGLLLIKPSKHGRKYKQ